MAKKTAPVPQVQQPYQLTELSSVEQTVNELVRRYDNVIYDVTTKQGMEAANKDHSELRSANARLEEAHKKDKAFYWEGCCIADEKKRQLSAIIAKYKEPLAAQIKAEKDRVAEEQAAKIRAENERRQGIQLKIQKFRTVAQAMVNSPSDFIEATLEKVKLAVIDTETYAEWIGEATQARLDACVALESLLIDVQEKETEVARIAADRAELARLQAADQARRELEEKEREAAKHLANEQRYKEAIERDKADHQRALEVAKEQAAADKVRLAQEAEQRRLDAEKLVLDNQRKEQEASAVAAAERLKALSKARRPTPEKALADILGICKTPLTEMSAFLKVTEIELIAEASLPTIIPTTKTKQAARKPSASSPV